MKQVRGFWLPDGEDHLVSFLERGPEFAGGPTYQAKKWLAALPHCRNFRHYIDVGAHCGLWVRPLAACFATVTAFEPLPNHLECLEANLRRFDIENVVIGPYALGAGPGTVKIATAPTSSGDSRVADAGVEVEIKPLDDLKLEQVDLLKIDCEGYELFVLKGGEKTIRRDRPCIVVEQKPGKARQYGLGDRDAVALLKSWGATLRWEISGDFCLTW